MLKKLALILLIISPSTHAGLFELEDTEDGNLEEAISILNGTPLLDAAAKGDIAGIRSNLMKNRSLINQQNIHFRTALHFAVAQGQLEAIKELLRWKANPNIADLHGYTPLMIAVKLASKKENILQIAQQLLTAGARPTDKTKDGDQLIHIAAMNGDIPMIDLLCRHGASILTPGKYESYAMHRAAAHGKFEVVEWLIKHKGIDINTPDPERRTVLHWAAKSGKSEAIKKFLEWGTDPTRVNNKGHTPLDTLLRICQELAKHGRPPVPNTNTIVRLLTDATQAKMHDHDDD